MKTYHFLAGLPRSGNTLLSSILNQNPEIYSSPISPLADILFHLEQSFAMSENNKEEVENNFIDVGNNNIISYYKNINKKIIIDRQKGWASPGNLYLLKKYINKNPKIIFTVRPVIEILTSFISLLDEESYIDREMSITGWWSKSYLSKNDNRCEYLMRPQGQIDKGLFSLNEVLKTENQNTFHLVKYEDIIKDPETTMRNIYNFLKIQNYKHNFNNITKIEKDFDASWQYPKNLHTIRKTISKTSKNPKDVLSEYIINKYSNMGCEII